MGSYELPERSRRLLTTLVREHIETGEPVASQSLARRSGLGVSSATVRNILAQLEEAELCPSATHARPAACRPIAGIASSSTCFSKAASGFALRPDVEHAASAAGRPFADDRRPARQRVAPGVARRAPCRLRAVPTTTAAVLQRIEFVALGGSRVLVVVVSRGNQITQKVVDAGEERRVPTISCRRPTTSTPNLPACRCRRARGRAGAAAAGAHAVRPAAGARAAAGAARRWTSMPRQQTFHVEGAASLLDGDGRRACRWPRCGRCSR